MTDRKVTVSEADLRQAAFGGGGQEYEAAWDRLRAALDTLGPEPCGHPSYRTMAVLVVALSVAVVLLVIRSFL